MTFPVLTEIFSAVAAGSWRAGWLILALAALRVAVRGRIPAQVWFAVWIVVALRLLLPFSLPAAWSPYNWTLARVPVPAAVVAPDSYPMRLPKTEGWAYEQPVSEPQSLASVVANLPMDSAVPLSPIPTLGAWDVAALLWLAGAVALFAVRVRALTAFRGQLRRARAIADPRLVRIVAREATATRRGGRGPAVLETDAVDAPALFGLLRPKLLFPPRLAGQLTDDELRLVVRHELGHWQRRDLLAQSLMQAALVLHWFNPLVWLAARWARTDCELACDEFVLQRETAENTNAYGAALLKVLSQANGGLRAPSIVGIGGSRRELARRVRSIANYEVATWGRVAAGLSLIGALAAASMTRELRAQAAPAVLVEAASPVPEAASAALPRPASASAVPSDASLQRRIGAAEQSLRLATAEAQRLEVARNVLATRIERAKDARAEGRDLSTLPFFSPLPRFRDLRTKYTAALADKAFLGERYLENHPRIIDATARIGSLKTQIEVEAEMALRELEEELRATHAEIATAGVEVARREEALQQLETNLAQSMAPNPLPAPEPAGDAAGRSTTGFSVSVVGAVGNQSAVEFSAAERPIVLDAIARAGGFSPHADRRSLRLIRLAADGSRSTHELTEAMLMAAGGEATTLQRGDVVVVSERLARASPPRFVTVVGAVKSPGRFPLPVEDESRLTLIEVLAIAGGQSPIADLRRVQIRRMNPDSGETRPTVALTVNLDEFLRANAEFTEDWRRMEVQAGDIVFVPEKTL